MNTLLLFFALPVATIILSIVLQKVLKSPILVAATFFAIFLVLAFSVFDVNFLVFAIVYTILSFLTASIVRAICNIIRNCCSNINNNICNTINNDDSYINDCNLRNDSQNYYPAQNFIRKCRRYN